MIQDFSKADCFGQKLGHNFPFTGSDCPKCGVNQKTLSGIIAVKRRKSIDWDSILKQIESRGLTAPKRKSTYLNDQIDQMFKWFESRLRSFAILQDPFDEKALLKYQKMRSRFFILGNKAGITSLKVKFEYAQRKGLMAEQFMKVLMMK